jgi:AcrR family transcriptional regulator
VRNAKADRRSQRTRRQISAALVELMLEMRYDDITVQDIIDRANIGRSTFYAHYLDKDDLLVSDFTRMLDALREHIEATESGNGFVSPGVALFFQHVHDHSRLYRALVRSGGLELLYKKGHEHLRSNIAGHLRAYIPADRSPAPPLQLVADYAAGALLTMMKWWLDNDMPYTPEQMDALFQQLVAPGVHATLQIDGAL